MAARSPNATARSPVDCLAMADSDAHSHDSEARETCQRCPVCLLLDHGVDVGPEVREHLRAAGRELALAVLAAIDGAGGEADEPAPGLRRLDLDEG